MNSNRIMIFYDGAYFRQGQVYFRYKEERGWFSLPQLHSTIERYVAQKAKTPMETTKVVSALFFDGRPTTKAVDSGQPLKDRNFEMAQISAGIIPHYHELLETPKGSLDQDEVQYRLMQKGVDVHLALDVLDYAHEDRLDVAVLVTGDRDFVPLVRKLTSLGKQVLVAYFEFDGWTDNRKVYHRPCYCSIPLKDSATFCLNFNQIVKDQDWKTEVKSMFFKPKSPKEEL